MKKNAKSLSRLFLAAWHLTSSAQLSPVLFELSLSLSLICDYDFITRAAALIKRLIQALSSDSIPELHFACEI